MAVDLLCRRQIKLGAPLWCCHKQPIVRNKSNRIFENRRMIASRCQWCHNCRSRTFVINPRAIPETSAMLKGSYSECADKNLLNSYMDLGNGSDIRGIAVGDGMNLTPLKVFFISVAFVYICKRSKQREEEKGKLNLPDNDQKIDESLRLCVGLDPRLSGPELCAAAIAGMRYAGCDEVLDGTLATTPAVFMATQLLGVFGGIMLTASHLPPDRNGMKFFTKRGGLTKEDIETILSMAASFHEKTESQDLGNAMNLLSDWLGRKESKAIDKGCIMPAYSNHLRQCILSAVNESASVPSSEDEKLPLKGMHIVVDAGNGSGGFFVDQVLTPLGATIDGSQLLDPDGTFPVHSPNPENAEAMQSAAKAVLSAGADIGIVFDTDVDRCAVVSKDGVAINRNRLIAIITEIILQQHPGTTIVTDSVTSDGLASFIASKGGKHVRYMRGYKNVINKGIQLNNEGEECHVMIETSGHGALKVRSM